MLKKLSEMGRMLWRCIQIAVVGKIGGRKAFYSWLRGVTRAIVNPMSLELSAVSQLETNVPDREPESGLTGLSGLLNSVISAGRDILARRRQNAIEAPSSDLLAKSKQLIHHRGEASGLALACEVVADYQALDDDNRRLFF